MSKIGGMELIVILVIALFAIGPERMPKAARTLGRAMAAFKKSMNEATSELREVSDEFKGVTDEIANAQKTMKNAFLEADEEVKKTGRDIDEKMNGKKADVAQAEATAQQPESEAEKEPQSQLAQEAAQEAVAQSADEKTDDGEQHDALAAG